MGIKNKIIISFLAAGLRCILSDMSDKWRSVWNYAVQWVTTNGVTPEIFNILDKQSPTG
jgi:hypothetical protein